MKKELLNKYINKNFDGFDLEDINNLILKAKKLNKELYNNKYNTNLLCLAIFKRIKELHIKSSNDNHYIITLIYNLVKEPQFYEEKELKNTALAMFIDIHIDIEESIASFVFYENYCNGESRAISGSYIVIDLYFDMVYIGYTGPKKADASLTAEELTITEDENSFIAVLESNDNYVQTSNVFESIEVIPLNKLTKEKLEKYLKKYEIENINSFCDAEELIEFLTTEE